MLSVPFLNDKQNRRITYLRISVTSDCNLQCSYCATGKKQKNSLLSFDEITRIVNAASKIGISKIRITGGEPLLRENLSKLINQISEIKGINDISITTNGILLEKFAEKLFRAGLKRINISLDSLNPEIYNRINGGNLKDVLNSISHAKKFFKNIRINVVLLKGVNEKELSDFIEFGLENNLTIRFLELMPVKTMDNTSLKRGDCSVV